MGITWRLLFCCASTLLYPWERATMHFTETVPRTFGKTVLAADLKIRSDLARELGREMVMVMVLPRKGWENDEELDAKGSLMLVQFQVSVEIFDCWSWLI